MRSITPLIIDRRREGRDSGDCLNSRRKKKGGLKTVENNYRMEEEKGRKRLGRRCNNILTKDLLVDRLKGRTIFRYSVLLSSL